MPYIVLEIVAKLIILFLFEKRKNVFSCSDAVANNNGGGCECASSFHNLVCCVRLCVAAILTPTSMSINNVVCVLSLNEHCLLCRNMYILPLLVIATVMVTKIVLFLW